MTAELSPALQDYMQAILRIERRKRVARVRDISRALGVHKSTVTAALRSLAEKKLVSYEPYEAATLTPQGRRTARRLDERHLILRDFLEDVLGIAPEKADSSACRIEHAVDEEVMERFLCFLAFLREHPRSRVRWLKEFRRFCRDGSAGRSCRECIERYLETLKAREPKAGSDPEAAEPAQVNEEHGGG